MAGDNRPLPAAQSMTYCPRVDVCLSKHTHIHTHTLYIFFSTSNPSLSKISAFSHGNIEAPPSYIQTENLSPLVPLKRLKMFSDRKKKMSFSRSDEKSWLYGEICAYLLYISNPSAKHVHAIRPTTPTGGVWAV